MIISSSTLFAFNRELMKLCKRKKQNKKMRVRHHPHLLGLDTVELEDRRRESKQWLSRACEQYILWAL